MGVGFKSLCSEGFEPRSSKKKAVTSRRALASSSRDLNRRSVDRGSSVLPFDHQLFLRHWVPLILQLWPPH